MTKIKIQNLRFINTTNKGFWLMARIYSDTKGACPCGGTFTGKATLKKVEYPVCENCGETPSLFRIRAKIVDLNFEDKYIDIRHSQTGERLKDIFDCFSTLKQIESEIEAGIFDIRRYDSQQNKESYLFENFSDEYLSFHENRLKRGEITPSGYDNKKKYVKVLRSFFSGKDIASIRVPSIEQFKNSFTDRFRTRDLALGELKALLNFAHRMEVIGGVPKFDLVPSSRKRSEIISMDNAKRIISEVSDHQYKVMIALLAIYPIRPSELRAIQWRDIGYFEKTVKFCRHFSKDILIDGRKSVSGGEKSELTYPLVKEFEEYLMSIPRPLNSKEFIFTGSRNDFVSEKCLSNAWKKALAKVNKELKEKKMIPLPAYQLYELRHARLSQIAEQSNGDIVKMLKVSGHTNPKTLMERYVRSSSDLTEFFH